MYLLTIVFLSMIIISIFELKFLFKAKIDDESLFFSFFLTILLPFWNQDLVSVFPFLLLIISFLLRVSRLSKFEWIFWATTIFNIIILYFQIGFFIRNFIISILWN